MTDDLISSRASLAKAMMILMGGLYTTDSLPDCRISLEGKARRVIYVTSCGVKVGRWDA